MLLLYLYAVLGQIDMLSVVEVGQNEAKTAINPDFERRESEFIISNWIKTNLALERPTMVRGRTLIDLESG